MDLRKIYNEETVIEIENFIRDFENIFPGLLSRDEIIRRIITNMKENIVFDVDLGPKTMGEYNGKKISVSNKASNRGQVLFHEFIHVLTEGDFVNNFIFRHLIEGLTTLAEEMYVKYKGIKLSKRQKHVNGYIPTFVRQINFVKDGSLLEEFIKDPSGIYKLFLPKLFKYNLSFGREEKDYKLQLQSMARKNENIVIMAKNKYSDQKINPIIKDLEEDILDQYSSAIVGGIEEFSGEKISKLYELQLFPNIIKYVEVLDELLSLGKISREDISKCGKLGAFYSIYEKDEELSIEEIEREVQCFSESELDWLASAVFGYTKYIYDSESLVNAGVDIDKLFEEAECYEELIPLYRIVLKEILDGSLDINNIRNCYIRRCSEQEESFGMQEFLRDVQKTPEELLLRALLGGADDGVGVFALEDEDGIKMIRDDMFFYYPVDAVSFLELIRSMDGDNKDILLKCLEKYSDFDVIFKDSTVDYDINNFGHNSLTIYVQKGSDLMKVKISLCNGKIDEEIEVVSFLDEKRSLFEKDTSEKLKSKDSDF